MEPTVALHRIVREGHGRLFYAPGVRFPPTGEGVQPDLVFVSRTRQGIIRPDRIEGPPDLIVEILSPSTESRDRGVKRKLYQRRGVAEYWMVDVGARAVEVWRFEEPEARCERFTGRLPVRLDQQTVGEIDLSEIFGRD